jgi:outer membrane receptor protein involved in Fe transport
MLKHFVFKSALIALVCFASLATHARANDSKPIDVPAGDLITALKTLARQSGIELIYRSDQLEGLQTRGVSGALSAEAAVSKLLEGTQLTVTTDTSGAMLIGRPPAGPQPARPSSPSSNSDSTSSTDSAQEAQKRSFWDRFRVAQVDQGSSVTTAPGGGSAPGDQQATRVEEVLVTAQKRSERLQDVPVPVSAVNTEALVESNQLRLQDFYSRVPGFNVAPSPGAGGQQSLSIRGISTGSFTVPTVGVTVDDVPYGSSTNFAGSIIPDFDPSDLERIEVLRGPQGALYGASSMGGLLKFVTIDPETSALSGRVQVGMSGVRNASSVGYNVRGAVNVPLSDSFAIRASGFTREVPGYIDNPFIGEKGVNDERVSGGRVSALWRASDALSLKLSALYQDDKGDSSNDVNVLPGLGDLEQSYIRGGAGFERKTQAYSATVSAQLGAVDLVSITGYNINEFFHQSDSTYSLGDCCTFPIYGVTGSPLITVGKTQKFSQEVRATLPIGERLELLVGGFYAHEDSPYRQINYASVPTTGEIIAQSWDSTYPSRYSERGEFATLTIHFTDRFDLQLGGREAQIHQRFGPCVYTGPLFGDGGCPLTFTDKDAFTYLVTPRFRITPDLMVYARAASGFRAGGPNVFNPDPAVPRSYSPDKTETYEIGAKGTALDSRLTFDASLFYIDFTGLQINLLDENNGLVYTTNGSRAKSQGVELTVELRPVSGLSIAGWATYTDATLTEDMPPTSTVSGVDGTRLPYSARASGNLSITQEFPMMSRVMGSVGATLGYVGARKGSFVGPTTVRQDYASYTKLDLTGAVKLDTWSAVLYINNATDRRGVLGGGNGTYPPFAFTYLQPRTYGVTVSKSF